MTLDQSRQLIDRLDESLAGRLPANPESIAGDDPEMLHELYFLRLAVDAVKDAGLYDEITVVRTDWKMQQSMSEKVASAASRPQGAIVRSINRYGLRAAAVILILTTGTAVYKYVSVNPTGLYNNYFSSYDLHTSRGAGAARPIEDAYEAKDWGQVVAIAAGAKQKDNQIDFLAGMADLELKKFDDAITHFEQVIAVNATTHGDYYQDEAEYYLAISWLARGNVNEAMPILERIKADANHKYHQKVEKMSFFDLRLVQYKENK
jgi:tetratricopeptide (TPR) repeat protein